MSPPRGAVTGDVGDCWPRGINVQTVTEERASMGDGKDPITADDVMRSTHTLFQEM